MIDNHRLPTEAGVCISVPSGQEEAARRRVLIFMNETSAQAKPAGVRYRPGRVGWTTRLLHAAVLVLTFHLIGPASAQPAVQRCISLVIGIGNYQAAPKLANPVKNARFVGEALRSLAFDVDEIYDPDYRTLAHAIQAFSIKAQQSDVALVFYSGHGVQVERENYLLPTDTKLERERDLLYGAIPLERLMDEVSQASKLAIIMLDASRNNPFVERMSRSMTIAGHGPMASGLARVDNVPRNTVVIMATKADQVAEDGTGEHSPFATALQANLATPGLELSLFLRSVRDDVLKATDGRQEPYVFGSVGAEPFYFHPRPPSRPPVLGPMTALEVSDTAGLTPLAIGAPRSPDGESLTVRVTGLPRYGEIQVDGRPTQPGAVFAADGIAGATYKPELGRTGPVGTFDILVEGSGGSVPGSMAISVVHPDRPPVGEPAGNRDEPPALGAVRADRSPVPPQPTLATPDATQQLAAQRLAMQQPVQPPQPEAPKPSPPATPGPDATPRTDAPPKPDAVSGPDAMPRSGERDCPTCPVVVGVPGGSFVMGLGAKDPAALPQHRVTVRSFVMGQSPVTVADWNACQAGGGCGPAPRMSVAEDATPLHNVSWDDAQQYLAWLSRAAGRPYRLPTEAEWEYAARGKSSTRYPWGEQLGVGLANCADCGGSQDPRAPAPALTYQPNLFGLYGMSGGVAQWVQDCWFPTYAGAPQDGTAREARGCSQRVLRGGSFRSTHDDITPTARNRYDAPVRYYTNGFRVARNAG